MKKIYHVHCITSISPWFTPIHGIKDTPHHTRLIINSNLTKLANYFEILHTARLYHYGVCTKCQGEWITVTHVIDVIGKRDFARFEIKLELRWDIQYWNSPYACICVHVCVCVHPRMYIYVYFHHIYIHKRYSWVNHHATQLWTINEGILAGLKWSQFELTPPPPPPHIYFSFWNE